MKNTTTPAPVAELLNEREAAAMLGVSGRHLRRMADGGKAPRPVRLGGAVRWRRAELMRWLADGCPRVRIMRGGAA